jgi:replication factor C subunit 3/5
MNNLPWIEKYRPNNFNDIISHDQNILTIKKLLINSSLPHLLFYGPPGTGKTSTILTIAREMYGDYLSLMVLKLDASDDRGINSVREDIKGFAERSNMFIKGVRLIILDEADAMTYDAQFALRRIIEKYSETIRFCLICNYENKIIPAIRSRCANFRFTNISNNYIIDKLKYICKNENINCNNDILNTISNISKGDLRKAINLLQSVSLQSQNITNELCYKIASIPNNDDIIYIYNNLINKNLSFNDIYEIINNFINKNGYQLYIILNELIPYLINNNLFNPNLLSDLSDFEEYLSKTTFEDIYINLFISIFKKNL